MTTQHTHHITIIAVHGSGPQTALDKRAQGDHLLWDPNSPPTHVDADGTEYRVAEAPWTPEIADYLRGIENSPQITVVDTGEVVPISEVGGREVLWRYRRADTAMVRTVERADVLEGMGLTRIERDDLKETDDRININTAPSEDLQTLDGVGPTLAQRIIDDRPYGEVDDLTRVDGVSQGMVDGWREEITA